MRHKSESLLDVSEKASQLSLFSEEQSPLSGGLCYVYFRKSVFGHSSFCLWSNEKTMKIGGFQKLTLLNYPGKTACTVFTSGCNFHCPWCHNSGLINGSTVSFDTDQIIDYLHKRKNMLQGVCVSGGEPTIHADLPRILEQIKALGFSAKLDTNGSNPRLLEEIIRLGLCDAIAMDVKNTPEKYAETIGLKEAPLDDIQKTVELLKNCTVSVEFRTTIIDDFHTKKDIEAIAEWLKGKKPWYLQSYRETPEVSKKGLHAPSAAEMESYGSIGNRYLKTMIRE